MIPIHNYGNKMIKKSLILSSSILFSVFSAQLFATVSSIEEMNITSGTITRNFRPTPDTISLNLTGNTNLVGGYINKDTTTDGIPISVTNFGMNGVDPSAPPQYVYTAASNVNHNGNSTPPATGSLPGGLVPRGTVDDVAGSINMDLSSWFANHAIMDQNLGSSDVMGTWDSTTGAYDMSWTATLTQGPGAGGTVTWNLQGNTLQTSPVPVPGAVWLLGTALLGLQRFKSKSVAV